MPTKKVNKLVDFRCVGLELGEFTFQFMGLGPFSLRITDRQVNKLKNLRLYCQNVSQEIETE